MKGYTNGAKGVALNTDRPPDVSDGMDYVISPMGKDWRMRGVSGQVVARPFDVGEAPAPTKTYPQTEPFND